VDGVNRKAAVIVMPESEAGTGVPVASTVGCLVNEIDGS
jgi:hypothetical protein